VSTDLARHAAVHELVAAFQEAERDVRRAFAIVLAVEERLGALYGDSSRRGHISVEASRHRTGCDWDADAAVERMARNAWGAVAERLEIRRMLSVKRAKELDERLERGDLPPLTVENVADFAEFYLEAAPVMMAEAVREVFGFLRPWRDTYKTNSRTEIGPKVVLEHRVERAWSPGYHVRYGREAEFVALDNVFSMLDGRGTVAKSYHGELSDAIKASGDKGRGETRYFRFKCFRNGNLHLQFLRLDLLRTLNEVAGGKNIKPTNGGAEGRRDGLATV
jgi:hypothetical protein